MPKILTLNDNPVVLQGIHDLLEAVGYQHLYTTNSHQALSIMRQEPIDLFTGLTQASHIWRSDARFEGVEPPYVDSLRKSRFIQDLRRPDMNGFELYWRIKSEEKLCDIPILIFSAWSVAGSLAEFNRFKQEGKTSKEILQYYDSRGVKVTRVKLGERAQERFYKVEFKEVPPEYLSAVTNIKDANVLYVEGYLHASAILDLVDTIEKILLKRSQSPQTEEERAIRYRRLWSQATQQFDTHLLTERI